MLWPNKPLTIRINAQPERILSYRTMVTFTTHHYEFSDRLLDVWCPKPTESELYLLLYSHLSVEITDFRIYESHLRRQTTLEGVNMVPDNITCTIANVLKQLDVAFVDDTTYKKLENMGAQYEYIDNDLLEQMIEAELIIMLERDNWYGFYQD